MALLGLDGLLINFLTRIKTFLRGGLGIYYGGVSPLFSASPTWRSASGSSRSSKAGKVLPVEPKAFRALLFLLRNPQKLISKEELLNAVWGDVAVGEGSLTRCIWLLRRLLGDDIHEPRYIETVATVGYRFVCKVEVSEDVQDIGMRLEACQATETTDGAIRPEAASARAAGRWLAAAVLVVGLAVANLVPASPAAAAAHHGIRPDHPRRPPEKT